MNEHLPVHIHVTKADGIAKFVLVPEIELSYSQGFKIGEIREIVSIIKDNYSFIVQKWYETFNQ
jgi:hypothetical protein